jgi:hypothetical protein
MVNSSSTIIEGSCSINSILSFCSFYERTIRIEVKGQASEIEHPASSRLEADVLIGSMSYPYEKLIKGKIRPRPTIGK